MLTSVLATVGISLLAVNLIGSLRPHRSALLAGYREPGWHHPLLPRAEAIQRLSDLSPSAPDFVASAHTLFTHAFAHPIPDSLKTIRPDRKKPRLTPKERRAFGLTVSAWENWVLWLLGFLKQPGYYGHVVCNWRRAVGRGIGDCEQQAIAVTGFFAERGFRTGFLTGWNHVIPMVQDPDSRWWLADPDFGVLAQATPESLLQEPERIRAIYRGIRNRGDDTPFGAEAPKPPHFALGGPASRYPIACPIERLSYVLKWAIPLALVGASTLWPL
ncbi:MAG: hypothetical protein H6844_01090 [Alphaproteobacteria bacterium]|nr:hypothetical protein [Alphaproteobacteria bacterium]